MEPSQFNAQPFSSTLPDQIYIEDAEIENINAPYGSKYKSLLVLIDFCCIIFSFTSVKSEVISRVFDGDLCATREEAYQKFRERQIREAYASGQFFNSIHKRINRVVDSGGFLNLISANQSSIVNTQRSRQSSNDYADPKH